jgi:diguanylate cyclase (GGDEF)-like protein/PAS domain S-box-containing protein
VNLILLVVASVVALASSVLAAWSLRRQNHITRELAVSRERYMLVAEGANDGIFDFDVQARRIFFSPRVYQMLGYPEGDLRGPEDLKRIVLPEDYERAREILYAHMAACRTDELRRVMRMRTRDGRTLTILVRSVTRYAADGTPQRVAGSYTDITERLGNERQLRLAASVFEAGSDCIVISDAHGRIVSVNGAFLDMTGYVREELEGRPVQDVLILGDAGTRAEAVLRETGAWSGDLAWRKRNGDSKTLETSVVAVRDEAGAPIFRIHVCTDAAELKYAQARIRHLAYFDTLTGLPNRAHLRAQFELALARARHAGQPLAVVFFDLDNFKEINDTAGHSVGDEVICVVAQRLGEGIREDDVLCRFGGDEFLLLLPNTDAHAAQVLARRLIEQMCKPVETEGRSLDVAASAGFSVFPDDATDAENLMRVADTALFRAKAEGGHGVQRFQSWMGEAVSWRHDLQAALRAAVAAEEFVLRYQPIVNVQSRRVAGFEALLYWNRPGAGVVGPSTFIAVAEETRLIEPIGAWVISAACRQIEAWKRAGMADFYVSVNVSGMQLRVPGRFQEHLTSEMLAHGVTSSDLMLEITERHLVQDAEGGASAVADLTAQGLRVSVDDFGTGYSNLESLKRLTVSQIKIDRTFVRNLMTEVGDRAIVQSIVTLGLSLGLDVVAEGVETLDQQNLLEQFGCERVQGYLYARPLPAEEIPPFVASLALRERADNAV